MIYITGDTHGGFGRRFNTTNFPEQREMTKDDYVIICGDFGGVWDVGWESKREKHWLDWFEDRSYTLFLLMGIMRILTGLTDILSKNGMVAEFTRSDRIYFIL